MSTLPSPLRLKRSVVISTRVESVEDAPEAEATPINSRVAWREAEEDPRDWRIELEVTFGEQDGEIYTPYHGAVEVALEMEVHPGFPEEQIEPLIRVNGTSLAYGIVREVVANLTARGPHGVYLLPSISFVEPPGKPEEAKKSPDAKAKPGRKKAPAKKSAS
ncbi:MAG: protein-export chaperone SecB [Verrucomicrobiae bacterium]|nr:protein-export chaperone SecB [Verrucomicrobiae bacterium]MCP5550547.1 protein-export chaperone SecB [Akkermansiaceae bacterium]